jgi:hypothetical protein
VSRQQRAFLIVERVGVEQHEEMTVLVEVA